MTTPTATETRVHTCHENYDNPVCLLVRERDELRQQLATSQARCGKLEGAMIRVNPYLSLSTDVHSVTAVYHTPVQSMRWRDVNQPWFIKLLLHFFEWGHDWRDENYGMYNYKVRKRCSICEKLK